MGLNILIVEDQFIEANDLKIILEKAGHLIHGVAKSVEQALVLIKRNKPDIVLLDIYLKGPLTGIDLAHTLTAENIPFVYLTANSNESIFEAAKLTKPYGFLVKPFREKDILAALGIASYRHQHTTDLISKQDRWLTKMLSDITQEKASAEEKLLMLCKVFKPFIHFDLMLLDIDVHQDGPSSIYIFQRLQFDDYEMTTGWPLIKKWQIDLPALNDFRRRNSNLPDIRIENEAAFAKLSDKYELFERIGQRCNIRSLLSLNLKRNSEAAATICFFSLHADYYNREQEDLLDLLKPHISFVVQHIKLQRETNPVISTANHPTGIVNEVNQAFSPIIGRSPVLLKVLDQVSQAAPFGTTVLISGETGVGKEGIAQAIHQLSDRRNKPFVKINCAAIPSTLIESELFGHEPGSFTGATDLRIGKFEQAQGGTIFLDEIGEIPLEVQSKLLRFLQERELERLGGRTTIKVDVRIIAATNRNLYQEVAAGRFRIDLYYRINVFPITIPPLRERKEDIPLLVTHFLRRQVHLAGGHVKEISSEALSSLINYTWPGNVRELEHLVERHILLTSAPVITSVNLPDVSIQNTKTVADEAGFQTIADLDRAHILAVLKKCNGKVSGRGGAAEILQIPSTTLTSKMKKLGIARQY